MKPKIHFSLSIIKNIFFDQYNKRRRSNKNILGYRSRRTTISYSVTPGNHRDTSSSPVNDATSSDTSRD